MFRLAYFNACRLAALFKLSRVLSEERRLFADFISFQGKDNARNMPDALNGGIQDLKLYSLYIHESLPSSLENGIDTPVKKSRIKAVPRNQLIQTHAEAKKAHPKHGRKSYCKLCLRPWHTLFRRRVNCNFCQQPVCSECAARKATFPSPNKRTGKSTKKVGKRKQKN